MQEDGKSSPLDDLPDLTLDESIYYKDFNNLCTERVSSMGLGSIPVTRIHLYAQQNGIHNIPLFEEIIMSVDGEYVKLISEKQEKQSKKGK